MSKQKVTTKKENKTNLFVYLWQNKWLYLMLLPAVIWVIVFNYTQWVELQLPLRALTT